MMQNSDARASDKGINFERRKGRDGLRKFISAPKFTL